MSFCGRFINGSDETFDITMAHRILNNDICGIDVINADGKIKLSTNEDIFFIEKEREDFGEYSPIHDEHIQYTKIKCFSNYYSWGDGDVMLIEYDGEHYIL